ncbi:Coenzyme A disulfide reductase [Sebaldella termitidis]|uniref:FAD-dependent pyridine nucleotide-disulphide oxidoreductase n=1 Tax=Sebaldella termitidis (strain ATCC 33386 / NCTC 11300) TaxID=526218 RepID=D1AJU7_SEBTE|nr:FAD-dependent oxidoreductase [Sebaldella termitidis]ACZ07004.1 FAD-dependent pyridine nucleotide-disulphide oxidoreductase [Sebaldella termitidis ATCC 33386]SUI22294.1 Coenzyme A disulfide reductase [Sebaldella termitidis]
MKIIIIGGVAGGMSAAARLRRLDEKSDIIVIEKSGYVSFANCGLPYYIGGVIKEKDSLLLETPSTLKEKFNLDVRVKSEAVSINREKKEIKIKNIETNDEYTESYDKLLISTGAKPFVPDIKGLEEAGYLTLRNIEDMEKISSCIDSDGYKNAVIIGGGFIGLETAENLKHKNINVTIIEKADQVMAPLDPEMASFIHGEIKRRNIALYLNSDITEISNSGKKKIIKLKSGEVVETDIIIASIGVVPDSELAKNAGLKMSSKGAVEVDEYLKTSDSDIYAAGDVIEIRNAITGQKALVPLAGPANKQGRTAADNILGREEKYTGTIGTSIMKFFNMTAASTGINEKYLKKQDINYKSLFIIKADHAGYYPGASDIYFKILFEPETGKIFGAQAVGEKGADKKIDIIATAILGNISVYKLKDLETAYAPPFNSAKDIINYASYMAENIKRDGLETVSWNETDKIGLIDVRTEDEYNIDHIQGAVNMPLNTLRENMGKLDKNKEYIVYCKVGQRGYNAQRILVNNGYKVKNLNGGFSIYKSALMPQDNRIKFENDIKNDKHRSISGLNSADKKILDVTGLQCPGPIIKIKNKISELKTGEVLEVKATDPGFENDIKVWTRQTGNTLLNIENTDGEILAEIKKGESFLLSKKPDEEAVKENSTSLVIFSGDFDKVFAALVIANGALAMGNSVSIFFTFWGLNVLRKSNYKTRSKKGIIEKCFGIMMPKGVSKLKLSNMNFFGLGRKMINKVMKTKNIESLESLLEQYIENGGKITACTMSMDVMGIKKDELIENIEYGGVATYMENANKANHNLFI